MAQQYGLDWTNLAAVETWFLDGSTTLAILVLVFVGLAGGMANFSVTIRILATSRPDKVKAVKETLFTTLLPSSGTAVIGISFYRLPFRTRAVGAHYLTGTFWACGLG